MRYNIEYTWVTNPRIQNSWLPQDTGSKVEFSMLPFIIIDYTPGSGHGHIFEPCKWYRAPYAQTKKENKKEDFGLWSKSLKKRNCGRRLEWGGTT